MTHKVGEKGEVIEAVEEVLGETMAERVRIDNGGIDAVLLGKQFELLGYASGCYSFTETIEENIARFEVSLFEPHQSLGTESLRDVEPS